MESRLNQLKERIFFEEHSDDEWKKINEEVDKELARATDLEKQKFLDSGAGDLLTQIIEYME